ncbi:hypothetical protein [Engelhardtia mirabilis]|uniref:Uncharacterized protein n=1 Tax=Engelhardtia mirabilis TaxID=2528011 RepID=A0A518BS30_9BACT|nr:hypothetical protein Pla133_49060 [Planctomycetes bacterium Pla133]QDV04110.1 hypothetical protein Pla86_49040 [Planctomycetes bacterium Pla86]
MHLSRQQLARFSRAQRRSLQRFLPVSLLVGVALLHHWLVIKDGLTQWKGGGFGMFSTVDSGGTRAISVFAKCGEWNFRVSIPADLRGRRSLAKRLPSEEIVQLMLKDLSRRVWVVERYHAVPRRQTQLGPLDSLYLSHDDLVSAGRGAGRIEEWRPDSTAVPSYVIPVRFEAEVYRLEYDISARTIRRTLHSSYSRPGERLEIMAELAGLPLSQLARNLAPCCKP